MAGQGFNERKLRFIFEAGVAGTVSEAITAIAAGLDKLASKVDYTRRVLDTQITSVRESINNMQALGSAASEAGEKMSKVERAFSTIGIYGGAAGVIYAVTNALKGGVDATVAYDQALHNLKSITGATDIQTAQMGEKIKQVANTTKYGMEDIAKGMTVIAQAGYNAADTVSVMGAAATLAQGTMSKIETTAELLTTALNVFNLKAVDAGHAADIMANAMNKSKLDMDKLNVAMNYVGPVAANAGLSLEDTAASTMLLANAGLRASTIGTGLRQVLSFLLAPTKELTKLTLEHGFALSDLDPRMNSFSKVLTNLDKVLKSSSESFAVFGQRGASAGLILARAGHEFTDASGRMVTAFQLMKEEASEYGSSVQMAETTLQGLGDKITNTISKFQVLAVSVMEGSLAFDIFSKGLTVLGGAAQALAYLFSIPGLGTFLKDMLTLTAAVAGLSAAMVLLKGLMSLLVSGFGALGGVSLVTGLFTLFNGVVVRLGVAFSNMAAGIYGVSGAMTYLGTSLGTLLARTPVLLLLTVAVVSAVEAYRLLFTTLEEKQEKLGKQRAEIENNRSTLDSYVKALRETTEGTVSHARIVAEASSKYSELSGKLADSQTGIAGQIRAIQELSDVYKHDLIANLEKEIELIEKKRSKAAANRESAEGSPGSQTDEFGARTVSRERDSQAYLKYKAQEIEAERELAKVIAQEILLRSDNQAYSDILAQNLAKQHGISVALVQAETTRLQIAEELKKLSSESMKAAQSDGERIQEQNSKLAILGEEVAKHWMSLRDSKDSGDQQRFWDFYLDFLKKADAGFQKLKESHGQMTTEQQKDYGKLVLSQEEHKLSIKAIEEQIRQTHLARIQTLEEQLRAEYQAAAEDVAHKERHDVQIKKLERALAEEQYAIQKEVWTRIQDLRKQDINYFSDEFMNNAIKAMVESSRKVSAAVAADLAAQRKDFSAWVKREKAAIEGAKTDQKDAEAALSQRIRMEEIGEERLTEARYQNEMKYLDIQLANQWKIVEKARAFNETTYAQEKQRFSELVALKVQKGRDYEYALAENTRKRWELEEKQAQSVANTNSFYAEKNIRDTQARTVAMGQARIAVEQATLDKLTKQYERMESMGATEETSNAMKTVGISIQEKKLAILREEFNITTQLAQYELRYAEEKLKRNEITQEEYNKILKRAHDQNLMNEREFGEKMVVASGTTWERIGLGIKRFQDKVKTGGEMLVESTTKLAEGMADAFGEAFATSITGTESFAKAFTKLANSVIMDLTKMIAKQMIYNSISGWVGSIMPSIGNLLGTSKPEATFTTADIRHSGNINNTGSMVRHGLQLFHNGLASLNSDELLTVIQRGETVRTAAQERALQQQINGGGSGLNFEMNVYNEKEDAKVTTSRPRFDGVRWVADMYIQAKARNMI